MRLSKEDYRAAEDALWNYNYNLKEIIQLEADIINIGIPNRCGLPNAPYRVSDSTFAAVLRLEEYPERRAMLKQKNAVERAIEKVRHDDAVLIFNLYYKDKMSWQSTIEKIGMSERTFSRRKQELIEAVHKELKKIK